MPLANPLDLLKQKEKVIPVAMSSSDDDYGSMQELQNVGVVTNYKRTTALRSELAILLELEMMDVCGQRPA